MLRDRLLTCHDNLFFSFTKTNQPYHIASLGPFILFDCEGLAMDWIRWGCLSEDWFRVAGTGLLVG